jgi:tetratricopeptide (TPR) repeat protein
METKKEEVIRLLNSKRLMEAKDLLEEMFISTPRDTFVLYNLGMCYSELGNYGNPIETLEKWHQVKDEPGFSLYAAEPPPGGT